jgi:DNA-binding IclR family transcriptional regulator
MRPQTAAIFASLSSAEAIELVVQLLERRQATVSELVMQTGLPQPTVTRYLAELAKAGVLARERAAGPYSVAAVEETRQFLDHATTFALITLQVRTSNEQALQRRVRKSKFLSHPGKAGNSGDSRG